MKEEEYSIEWISREEANKYKMMRSRFGWRLELIAQLVEKPDAQALKIEIHSNPSSLGTLKKHFGDKIEFFSRTIKGKKYIFAVKK